MGDRDMRPKALLAGLLLLALAKPAAAASSEDLDWPCVQRQVPEVSAGMVWAGPSVEGLEEAWRKDAEVVELAGTIAARATEMEDASARIEAFARASGEDRNPRLTLLFAATLSMVNAERNEIIGGIKRYARRQTALAKKIEGMTAEYSALPPDGTEEQVKARDELREQLTWDTRIFDERRQSLAYVCETPVMLEQRIFALSRAIMNHLD